MKKKSKIAEGDGGGGACLSNGPEGATREFSKPSYLWDHYSGLPGVEAYKEE